jgi:sugar (pentulose or hexulose) kinase
MASLKIGMDILFDKEKAAARLFSAHGGLFKTEGVAQQYLADALGAPVAVMKTAGEGGAWGMALLAAYMVKGGGKTLADFLEEDVFADMEKTTLNPTADGERGFGEFMERYKKGLAAERAVMSR